MRRTGRKWSTDRCGRCGEPHRGYSGKTDSRGVEYVVCGNTGDRMNVSGAGPEGNSWAFGTIWYIELNRAV